MATISATNKSIILSVCKNLLLAGVDVAKLPFLVAQVCYETGWFKNSGFLKYNNFSGIKYTPTIGSDGKPIQKNATPATDDNPDNGKGSGHYAVFKTPKDWAIDYVRILSRGANPPIKANSIDDFVTMLRNNKYFEGSPSAYLSGLKGIIKNYLKGVIPTTFVSVAKLIFA